MIKYVFNKGLNNLSKLINNNRVNSINLTKLTNNKFFSNSLYNTYLSSRSFASFIKSGGEARKFKSEEGNDDHEDALSSPFDDYNRDEINNRRPFGSRDENSDFQGERKSNSFRGDSGRRFGDNGNFRDRERNFSSDNQDLGRRFSHSNDRFDNRRSGRDSFDNENSAPGNFSEVNRVEYTENHITITPEEEKKFYEENSIIINSKIKQTVPKPLLRFSDLSFDRNIIKYTTGQFASPTPIQSVTWPIAQSGHNLVGVAETGSGKTLSFLLPAMNHILNQNARANSREGPIVLVVAPTRELAMQIHKVASDFAQRLGFRTACLYGGAPRGAQIRQVVYGVEMIVATPGRLLDLVSFGKTNFNRTSFLVLDEADRMLDMGFERDLRKILSQVNPDSQTLMWSATWPKEIVRLAEEFLKDYVHIKIGKSENGLSVNKRIKQKFIFASNYDKNAHLDKLIDDLKNGNSEGEILEDQDIQGENENNQSNTDNKDATNKPSKPTNKKFPKAILFTNKKMKCESLVKHLNKLGLSSDSIHGDKSQSERDYAFRRFKNDDIEVLVATDVAARGLDVSDVKVVINYDFPMNIEDYVHRIGRTGRSGKNGISYAIFTSENYALAKPLKSLLLKAEQDVPAELVEITGAHHDFKKNKRGGGGSGRGGYSGGRSRSSHISDRY
jgi:superfamily II DNA/RNA helicase